MTGRSAPGCCLRWRGSIKVRNSSMPSLASSGSMGSGWATACCASQAWTAVSSACARTRTAGIVAGRRSSSLNRNSVFERVEDQASLLLSPFDKFGAAEAFRHRGELGPGARANDGGRPAPDAANVGDKLCHRPTWTTSHRSIEVGRGRD